MCAGPLIADSNSRPDILELADCFRMQDHGSAIRSSSSAADRPRAVVMLHPQNLLSHHRFSSRIALLCFKPAAIWLDTARARSTGVSLDRFANSQYLDDREYRDVNKSLLIGSACAYDDEMESVDDQIQAFWTGSNSVSGDRNAGSCRGRNRDQTLVGASRPPSAARYGCSHIYFCISANPRSRRCER